MRLWLIWFGLLSLAWASPERHQAWCQLMGVQIPYPQEATWQNQLELGPPLESVPSHQRAALWGQWSTSQQASQVALAQSLRRSYLLAALPSQPGGGQICPPFRRTQGALRCPTWVNARRVRLLPMVHPAQGQMQPPHNLPHADESPNHSPRAQTASKPANRIPQMLSPPDFVPGCNRQKMHLKQHPSQGQAQSP